MPSVALLELLFCSCIIYIRVVLFYNLAKVAEEFIYLDADVSSVRQDNDNQQKPCHTLDTWACILLIQVLTMLDEASYYQIVVFVFQVVVPYAISNFHVVMLHSRRLANFIANMLTLIKHILGTTA